jgi:26S proteasome regulatory subunit N9
MMNSNADEVADVLESMASSHPALAEEYGRLSDLFKRKLWHQLTTCLLEIMTSTKPADSESSSSLHKTADGSLSYVVLYSKVVLACDAKLNQLSLCRLASAVAMALASSDKGNTQDFTAARAILESLLEKKARLGIPASLFVESKLVLLKLQQFAAADGVSGSAADKHKEDYDEMKAILTKAEAVLTELEGDAVSPLVPSAHYQASTAYRKIVGPPETFYKEALMYLNYTPVGK